MIIQIIVACRWRTLTEFCNFIINQPPSAMKNKISISIFMFILMGLFIQGNAQVLKNELSADSIEINWDVKDNEFTDAIIFVAQNNSSSDKKVFLNVITKHNYNGNSASISFQSIDIPKKTVVSNIEDRTRQAIIFDSEYLKKNKMSLEVSIHSIEEVELCTCAKQ